MSKTYCPECGKQGCFGWILWLFLILVIGYAIGWLLPIKFSPPTDGSVAGSTSAQAHHIISCLDLQRELNRRYPEAKLVEDGICGKETQHLWDWDSFNRYALELWPE